eukprot:m.3226 g.3226  ORF g.3226 m.3226 type:complete len:1000 (+) comp9155_c0_seq1:112-3111(+)
MALLTVERNTPSVGSTSESEIDDVQAEIRSRSSSVEGFLATRSIAVGLGHRQQWKINSPQYQGEDYGHLRSLMSLIRPQEMCKLAVELESRQPFQRYIIVVSAMGLQDTEENLLLGVDWIDKRILRVALVFPIWRDTTVVLDGDGGFSITSGTRKHIFKPVSVQCMWAAFQALHKACELARSCNYFLGGLSHTWIGYYQTQLTSDLVSLGEWNVLDDIESARPDSPPLYLLPGSYKPSETELLKQLMTMKLKEVMVTVDLETVNSRQLRLSLEDELKIDLRAFKTFLDQETIRIFGQMKSSSEILDYLYLGSEWNASNFEELSERGIGYILNMTREIDNFFEGVLQYKNIRVYDDEKADLLRHWDSTYLFIHKARSQNSKVLVHCRMGISRSSSTVIAYLMKENKWSLDETTEFVKARRPMIHPNPNFQRQLKEYEGIIMARHNEKWGQLAPQPIRHRSSSDTYLLEMYRRHVGEEDKNLTTITEGGIRDPPIRRFSSDADTPTPPLRRSWAAPDRKLSEEHFDASAGEDLEEVKASRLQTYLSSLETADPVNIPQGDSVRAQSAPADERHALLTVDEKAAAAQKRTLSLSPTNLDDNSKRIRRVSSAMFVETGSDPEVATETTSISASSPKHPRRGLTDVVIPDRHASATTPWRPPESPMAQTITQRQCDSVRAMVFGFESKLEAHQQEVHSMQHRRQLSLGSRSVKSMVSSGSDVEDEAKVTSNGAVQLEALPETGKAPAPDDVEPDDVEPDDVERSLLSLSSVKSAKSHESEGEGERKSSPLPAVRIPGTRWTVVDVKMEEPSGTEASDESQRETISPLFFSPSVATTSPLSLITPTPSPSQPRMKDANGQEDQMNVALLVKKFQETTPGSSTASSMLFSPRPHSNSPVSLRRRNTPPESPGLTRSASFSKESPTAERRRLMALQSPRLKMRRRTLASCTDDDDDLGSDDDDSDGNSKTNNVRRLLQKFRKMAETKSPVKGDSSKKVNIPKEVLSS